MLANLAFDLTRFLLAPLVPRYERFTMNALLALLLELFGEAAQLFFTLRSQLPQLVESDDVMHPFRVVQQVLEVQQLLLYARRRTLMLLDAIL